MIMNYVFVISEPYRAGIESEASFWLGEKEAK
jgi:hypothetical protein